mmetsp:Transcript_30321/g.34066  ORF Transcript_30321/g.34066 Transcript_30321/m.34066 type:complete len:807 (+) Transcript_30321:120-2540(+)
MELLYSRAAPGSEFVSLSVLLRSDISGEAISCHLGEPLLLPSPLSTISQSSCVEVLTELHFYINSMLKATNRTSTSTTFDRFLHEDDKFLFGNSGNSNVDNSFRTQIFRPKKCHGIAMQYHLTRDRKKMSHLVPLILNSSKHYSSKNSAGFELKEVAAVVFCVGIVGVSSALGTSCLTYSLSNRIKECIDMLCRTSTTSSGKRRSSGGGTTKSSSSSTMDVVSARSLLTTLLLSDDEDRITNSVVNRERRIVTCQQDQFSKRFINSKRRGQDSKVFEMEGDNEIPLHVNSADQGRIIVERMAVLSVCDSDTMFRKYEGRTRLAEKAGKKRLRKTARDADLDGFDFRGKKRSSSITNLVRKSNGGDDISVSARSTSTNTSNLTLKGPRKDTMSKTLNRSRQQALPGLLASNIKDSSTTRNRRIVVDHSVSGGRSRNMVGRQSTSIGHGIGNGNGNPPFASHNQSNYSSAQSVESDGGASIAFSVRTPPGSTGSRNQSRGRQNFHSFTGQSLSADTSTTASETTYSPDIPIAADASGIVAVGNHRDSGLPKVLINVALNEDLTCFYKLSKLSSCSVEGVIQVQVRSNTDQGVPFFLLIRDPSKYIQSIQENKKFADSMADSLSSNYRTMKSDYMFTISVPQADDYFPVMRYKCGNKLRPVPIRVQTRVRLEENHWRVALQISSNPHNEDNLTDLTIIMGVPPSINGESLTTSPSGGAWNASKRSVIWCVSELGGGEKFQLQAKFEIDLNAPNDYEDEKPKFPVLVRCQCMYAQLSDIEVDVRDIPQVLHADLKMKLARRFRLSHRERP